MHRKCEHSHSRCKWMRNEHIPRERANHLEKRANSRFRFREREAMNDKRRKKTWSQQWRGMSEEHQHQCGERLGVREE
jgi:hypothetical protein